MNPALTSAQAFDEKCLYCENAPLERDKVRLICNGNGGAPSPLVVAEVSELADRPIQSKASLL
jgi:hypothetical protein